jgi:hypothetical protein
MKIRQHSLFISIAIVLTAMILSYAFINRSQKSNIISVTGLGSRDFVSDLIVWRGKFTRKNDDLKLAYAELDADRAVIQKYLSEKGFTEKDIVFSSIKIQKLESPIFDQNGEQQGSVFAGYQLEQEVVIESKQVDKVEGISREVSRLINQGVEFYSEEPQYYYTKLAELKIEMIAEATKDANIRATRIAENADSDVGTLKNAEMGVFQIVGQNSAEDYSWGGSFNTESKRKTASITVKLDYEVD